MDGTDKTVDDIFEKMIASFVAALQADHGDNLRAVVHFGSTVQRPIKRDTDVDLLLVFRTVPSGRGPRMLMTSAAEGLVAADQSSLRSHGYHIELSPLIKSEEEFRRFSLLYLDMVDHSRLLVDKDGLARDILDKTAAWIRASGAIRRQKGLLWYWDLNPTCRPGDVFKIGF